MQLRVLHTESSPGWGGQEKRILLECLKLRERGHWFAIAGQPEGRLGEEARREGLRFFPVRMRSGFDALALLELMRLLRQERINIIHTHSSKDSWLGGIAGRLLRVPAIVRTRHVSIPVSSNPLNLVYRLPNRVATTARCSRELILKATGLSPERVRVIPTGVELEHFNPSISGEPFRQEFCLGEGEKAVGIVAQLRGSKGHEHFVAAAGRICERRDDVRFFIVGDGHWRELIAEDIKGKGLEGKVVMTGYRQDIPEVMAGLDLLVIASIRTDGIPQSALQAMAVGLPVIGTEVGGIPEVLAPSGAGVLVPPGDPEALARAVEELLDDPSRMGEMGERGRAFVAEGFSLERMLDETERLYLEALGS
ncbi:MAG: glycosyltransferase family 4 protein [Nitrospinota bacterium]